MRRSRRCVPSKVVRRMLTTTKMLCRQSPTGPRKGAPPQRGQHGVSCHGRASGPVTESSCGAVRAHGSRTKKRLTLHELARQPDRCRSHHRESGLHRGKVAAVGLAKRNPLLGRASSVDPKVARTARRGVRGRLRLGPDQHQPLLQAMSPRQTASAPRLVAQRLRLSPRRAPRQRMSAVAARTTVAAAGGRGRVLASRGRRAATWKAKSGPPCDQQVWVSPSCGRPGSRGRTPGRGDPPPAKGHAAPRAEGVPKAREAAPPVVPAWRARGAPAGTSRSRRPPRAMRAKQSASRRASVRRKRRLGRVPRHTSASRTLP
mmetsp:Transcript_102096/g.255837  ORF Transcript_102096/g.255837 Transcript_102096/m.255837 type:complete len:317 (-) Transcript_102096:1066-2016(-)